MPPAPKIQLISSPIWPHPYINAKDVGVLYFSLIPCVGSRIALYLDKQLELAHVMRYCKESTHRRINGQARNCVQYTQRGRYGCASFGTLNLRDSDVEDGVRKRPIYQ